MSASESQVDPTVIKDNEQVSKALLREQLEIVRDEITEVLRRTRPARRIAYQGFGTL